MSIVKCCWSGGKDSSYATFLHIQQGDEVKVVNYIPMLNDNIPMLLKCHYDFILSTAERFRNMGATVDIVSGMTYVDFVHKRATRGLNKGKAFGFPPFRAAMCNFKRDSKVKALTSVDVGAFDYEDIAIAFDEVKRHAQLNDTKRSILVEKKITEHDARIGCIENGLLSPHYGILKRDGCTLCPHASSKERRMWFDDYPDAFEIVLELQEFVRRERPEQTPLRNYRWFIEEDLQVHFFDDGKTKYIIN